MQKTNGLVFLLVLATGLLAAPELAFAITPNAQNDEFSTPEDTTLTLIDPGVLGNDSDPEDDPITAVLDSTTTNGVLVLDSNGSFEYTPNTDFVGADSFSYHANDGTDDSNIATVTIQVNAKGSDSVIDMILEQIQMLFDKIFSVESEVAELKNQNAVLETRIIALEAKITSGSSDDDDDDKQDKKSIKNEIKTLKKEFKEKKKMLQDEFKEKERELKNHIKDSKHDKDDDDDDDD